MNHQPALPPGQRVIEEFPRFGGTKFAKRAPPIHDIRLEVFGAVENRLTLTTELAGLPRVSMTADFHCAATWSHRGLVWSGFRFKDVFDQLIVPSARPHRGAGFVILRCEDGYRTDLPLRDLLAEDVLIADCLNGAPLTVEHGAPIRLVAPAHYGYKNVKHLHRIELREDGGGYRPLLPRFMDHPRARVALEERGRYVPGWLLRYLFRPLVKPTIRRFNQLAAPSQSPAQARDRNTFAKHAKDAEG